MNVESRKKYSQKRGLHMSIKKVAEKVGVSPSTVSRVLNNPNYRCSSEKLKEKIWNAAVELNYSPNQAARNLKLGTDNKETKTFYINILVTRMNSQQTDPFFTELLRVLESEIHRGYCVLTKVWYEPFFSDEKKCRGSLAEQKIEQLFEETEGKNDGLIIIGKCQADAIKMWKNKYKSIVSVNRNSTNFQVDEVLCDGRKVSALAVEYLVSIGHTKIGYVGKCNQESRYKGYTDVLRANNLDLNEEWVMDLEPTEANGLAVMEEFLKKKDPPTAIYFANDIAAIGALKCLGRKRRNFYRPSIIATDDIEAAQYTKPMLTTVQLPKEDMGRFALQLLVDRMEGKHKGNIRMELEGKLVVRNSCTAPDNGDWSDYCI